MRNTPSPTENVMAVFAVLSQLWPAQFKRDVDQDDPAGVWKSNVGHFNQTQLERGLIALRKSEDKYMPNAPGCAKIFRGSVARAAEPDYRPVDPFMVSAWYLYFSYCIRMSHHRKQTITGQMGGRCHDAARRQAAIYSKVWDEETDKSDENYAVLVTDMGGVILREWNEICKIGLKVNTVADLMRI